MCNEVGEIDLRFSYRSAKLPGELSPRALSLLGSRSASRPAATNQLLLRCDRNRQVVGWTALSPLLIYSSHEIRVRVIVLNPCVHVVANRCYGRSYRCNGFYEGERLCVGQDRPCDVCRPINLEGADLAVVRLRNLAWEVPRQRNSLGNDVTRCGGTQCAAGISGVSKRDRVCTSQVVRGTNG